MNIHKHVLSILAFINCLPSILYGQEDTQTKNSLFLEGGGNALVYSINYEREFENPFSFRTGITLMPSNEGAKSAMVLMINYFMRDEITGNNNFEFGLGLLAGSGSFTVPTVSIGYRYSPLDGGFIFRITFTPFLVEHGSEIFPWGGIGLGYRF